MSSVYPINRSVNKPLVFRGLQAQYIWWLGIGLLVLLLVFVILYLLGSNMVICIAVITVLGVALFYYVHRYNRLYGEHGFMKKMAKGHIPQHIVCDQLFTK